MVTERLWGGIDLGRERVSICVTADDGTVVLERDVEADPRIVFEALEAISVDQLAMIGVEAGAGSALVRQLISRGLPIAVLEARKASKILSLRLHKTDANDARGLADIVRLDKGVVPRVHEKSPESRRIRARLSLRQQIVKQRVAGEQALRSIIREYGGTVAPVYRASGLRPSVAAALAALKAEDQVEINYEVEPLLALCEAMRRFEEEIERGLARLAKNHPVCSRLLSVPGIGPIAALSYYSAIDDPLRFHRSEDVACYLGLTPRIRESGKMSDRPRISRRGNAMTRSHLILAAHSVMSVSRQESQLKAQALALRERLGYGKSRVAVARKLSIILLSLWKSGGSFESRVDRLV